MIVVNLLGGPGAGKSTTAAALFVYLKNKGIQCELVGEAAKTFIYEGRQHLLHPSEGAQVFILATQYCRLFELARAGCEVVISDSPLLQQQMYAEGDPLIEECRTLAAKMHQMWPSVNVRVLRGKHFNGFGRTQKTVDAAIVFDQKVNECCSFDLVGCGDESGQAFLVEAIYKRLRGELLPVAA